MTRDYLVAALAQLEGEFAKATTALEATSKQQQAIGGAVQAVKQLIAAEDTNAAGGTLPDQGVTGPGL